MYCRVFPVLQSTTTVLQPVLQRTTKIILRTTQYNKELHSTARVTPLLARLIIATHETSSTLQRATSGCKTQWNYDIHVWQPRRMKCHLHYALRMATRVTLQHHQILPLPAKITLMIDPCHIWNVIYNARSNRRHPPTRKMTTRKMTPMNPRHIWDVIYTMRGAATGVTHQRHQILRLPRKMILMMNPRHIWTVIYKKEINRRHPPTSPKILALPRNMTVQNMTEICWK